MTTPTNISDAERQKAKALARWEGEGGTLGGPSQSLDERELRILARLGAAMLCEWDGLPEETRSSIFLLATKLHAERDASRIRLAISRILDEREEK